MLAQTLLFGVTILLIKCANAEYDVNKVCNILQPGTNLPSLRSCQTYYTCSDNKMAIKSTCPDNEVYNKNYQKCVPEAEGNCFYGLSNPCYNKDRAFAYCSNGCNWYNYCLDGKIAGNGTCELGERFNPVTGTCINGDCADIVGYDVPDLCEIIPDDVYFGDFESCQAWHLCKDYHEKHGVCEDSLVFDVTLGFCLKNDGKMCQRTKNVVDTQASGPPQGACTSANQNVGDKNVCSIYYNCQHNTQTPDANYEWVEFHCQNQFFDVISQECRPHDEARAYPGCDRCALTSGYASTYWTNAVNPNCQQYFTCKNGSKVGLSLGSCEKDYFFDETNQFCGEGEERLKQYKLQNGACQDYSCNDDLRNCSMSA